MSVGVGHRSIRQPGFRSRLRPKAFVPELSGRIVGMTNSCKEAVQLGIREPGGASVGGRRGLEARPALRLLRTGACCISGRTNPQPRELWRRPGICEARVDGPSIPGRSRRPDRV